MKDSGRQKRSKNQKVKNPKHFTKREKQKTSVTLKRVEWHQFSALNKKKKQHVKQKKE